MKHDALYLEHILERIRMTEMFTADGYDTFIQSLLIQEAVIRNFEVMGEAARRISEQTRLQYPSVPWRKITGLRNVLIHDYDSIDLNQVWKIVEHELPVLKPQIEDIVRQLHSTDTQSLD